MSNEYTGNAASKITRIPTKSVQQSTFSDLRLATLGIPSSEFTPSVSLAISALFEKIDDLNRELIRTKEHLNELEQLVDVDVLAPIPNRRAFMRRLEWAIALHERYNQPVSVLFFDLNYFKELNDNYGHACGDAALRHAANTLVAATRDSDFVARMGGDEFAVILFHSDYENSIKRAQAINNRITSENVFKWNGNPMPITLSVGVYSVKVGDTPDSALSNADTAMYVEKRRFKNDHQSPNYI